MSQNELIEKVRSRQVGPEDLVRRADSEWIAAFEVTGLMDAANRTKAPKKPSASKPSPASHSSATDSKPASSEADAIAADSSAKKAPSDGDWFCLASGEKRGPMRFDELQDLAKQGALRSKDRVWRTSTPKFKPASEIDGLQL
jgi:hypothetical protein